MRIGVVGDSHGDKVALERVAMCLVDVDLIMHTGDYFKDAHYLEMKTGKRVVAVYGNCDGPSEMHAEHIAIYNGVRFLLTHGHRYNVKYDLNGLYYKALEVEAAVVVFGHTHTPLIAECEGVQFMNPGSIHHPRGTMNRTYGIIELDETGKTVPKLEMKILR